MQFSTEELRAAVINAQTTVVNALLISMRAENAERLKCGYAIAHDADAFMGVAHTLAHLVNSVALHGEMP